MKIQNLLEVIKVLVQAVINNKNKNILKKKKYKNKYIRNYYDRQN